MIHLTRLNTADQHPRQVAELIYLPHSWLRGMVLSYSYKRGGLWQPDVKFMGQTRSGDNSDRRTISLSGSIGVDNEWTQIYEQPYEKTY